MTENKKKIRKDIEVEVRQKVDCEEKAFRWVEHLALVDNVSEEELSKIICEIMPCHYTDINEERAISKVCGYPLCCVKLGKRSPQKYHISTKHNKVIDLSIRGNFCSLYCYQASKYIEAQIPQVPIWLRDDKLQKLKLLERKSKEQYDIGEIQLGLLNLNVKEKEDTNEQSSEDEKCVIGIDGEEFTENKSEFQDNGVETDSDRQVPQRLSNKSSERKQIKLIEKRDIVKAETEKIKDYITKITGVLKEWITDKSIQHLLFISNQFHDSDDDDDNDKANNSASSVTSASFQSKVMNFLSRQPEWISDSNHPNGEENNEVKSNEYTLPNIDSKSQNSIRRRIVHEKLNGSLRELLPVCGLLEEDLTQVGFFKFVDTFNFTSKNIVLNLKNWLVMTIVLLKILSKAYQKDFGSMKKRHSDIDEFLIMRNLPNLVQMKDITGIIWNDRNSYNSTNDITGIIWNDRNSYNSTNEVSVGDTDKHIDTEYYYDNMEEVD